MSDTFGIRAFIREVRNGVRLARKRERTRRVLAEVDRIRARRARDE